MCQVKGQFTNCILPTYLEFRPTGQHANADGLSRLPLQEVTVLRQNVIPGKLQQKLLEEFHGDHPGISRMKAVARGGLDKSIQDLVSHVRQ